MDLKTIELGLDRPVLIRYFDWLVHAVVGDFGRSWYTTESVTQAIMTRLPVTISLVGLVMIVTTIVSFAIGSIAAIKRGVIDQVLQISTVIGNALPSFLVALVLVTLFAIQIKIFPATGYVPITQSVGGWLWALVLPVIALSIQAIAGTAQQVRSSVIATLRQDYVRTLRSRGIPERRVLARHVMRNAAASPMTVLSLQFVSLLSGAVVVETIFALPGLGSMAVTYHPRRRARGDGLVVTPSRSSSSSTSWSTRRRLAQPEGEDRLMATPVDRRRAPSRQRPAAPAQRSALSGAILLIIIRSASSRRSSPLRPEPVDPHGHDGADQP